MNRHIGIVDEKGSLPAPRRVWWVRQRMIDVVQVDVLLNITVVT